MAFIPAPTKIPIFLRIGIWAARKVSGQALLLARLLAWYPKAVVSSGILESLIAHHDGKLDKRILKMVRLGTPDPGARLSPCRLFLAVAASRSEDPPKEDLAITLGTIFLCLF